MGNLLAQADASNNIMKYYIHGAGLIAMVTPTDEVYCYQYNAIGSTVAVTNQFQDVVNKYAYDPFGNVVNQSETMPQPFKFVGQYGVMTEPNGFYYMRARYYDPNVGRFISEDPIGFEGGETNLFAYVGNQPINRIDPSGEAGITIGLEGAVALFGFGGQAGIYGNVSHDLKKSWYEGWSWSVTASAGGGAAASVYGLSGGVHVSANNSTNVSQLEGASGNVEKKRDTDPV